MSDVSRIIKGTGVALEQQAFNQFGAAVENQARNLGLIGGRKVPGVNDIHGPLPNKAGEAPIRAAESAYYAQSGVWEPTRYAAALTQAEQGGLDPKQKFLFKVTFWFDEKINNSAAISTLGGNSSQSDLSKALTFMVKQIDLPKVNFEYEEVNMYNYRTKVLKSISHRELNFSFMDDVGNSVMDFVNIYRMLLQPMARQNAASWESANYADYGFAFQKVLSAPDSALRGLLPDGAKRILRKIVIHQFYVNRGGSPDGSLDQMIRTNDFVFLNPQLTEMDMGELDHENGSTFNMVTANFAFDGLVVNPNQSVFSSDGTYKHKDISLDVRDMLTGPTPSLNINRGSSGIPAGGQRNPFMDIISNQAGRAVSAGITGALSRSALGRAAGGALSGVIYPIAGSLGDRTREAIGGWTQGTAAPNVSYIRDSAVSRQEAQDLSGRQTSYPGDGK